MIETFNIGATDWYTIETLQKLCFHKETAVKSVKLLFKIAINESHLKEKAKIAFIDVFQSDLGETSLDLESRITILNDLKEEFGINEILIFSYQRALKGYGYVGNIRSGDYDYAENQYEPTVLEKQEYFKIAVTELKSIALSENEYSETAKKALIFKITDQIAYGDFNGIINFINKISKKEKSLSIEIRQALLHVKSARYRLNSVQLKCINQILLNYEPKTVKEELEAIVINAPWINERDSQGTYINVSAEKAKQLAIKYKKSNNQEWLNHIELLLQGEQRQTFFFAEQLAKEYSLSFNKILLIKITSTLNKIPSIEQNGVFLNGFTKGINDDEFTRDLISLLLKEENTHIFSIQILKFIKLIKYLDILKVKTILEKGDQYLFNIEYLDFINLKTDEFKELICWVKEINHSFALQLLWELLRKVDKWEELRDAVNELLFSENILEFKSSINSTLHIEDLISKSLEDDSSSSRIKFIVNKILDKYAGYSLGYDSIFNNLLFLLLDKYWDKSWPLIGEFLSKKTKSTFGLTSFLERMNYDNEGFYNWALTNDRYPAIAITYMQIFNEDNNGNLSWNPFAKSLLDIKGSQTELLNNLSSRFIPYSISSPSAEQLYIKRKKMIEEILDHPIEKVKSFAAKMIIVLDGNISREKKDGENYDLGNSMN
jgi:hypothetical protein